MSERGWLRFPQYTRYAIPMFMVREHLAAQGLYVVDAKDKAVLDACALLSNAELGLLTGDERDTSHAECSVGEAEAARRVKP